MDQFQYNNSLVSVSRRVFAAIPAIESILSIPRKALGALGGHLSSLLSGVAKGYQGMGEQVNLLFRPRRPLPDDLDFGEAGVGAFPEGEESQVVFDGTPLIPLQIGDLSPHIKALGVKIAIVQTSHTE